MHSNNTNGYGPNYRDLQLRKDKLKLQNYKDLLTREELDLEDIHYHHIDYNKNNDDYFNHVFLSSKSHRKITRAQTTNPIEAEWCKRQLQENLKATIERRQPIMQKVNIIPNINMFVVKLLWDEKSFSISSRIEDSLYELIKETNIGQIIQNFIRKFLRDSTFRKIFLNTLKQQFDNDFSQPYLNENWFEETKVVSARVFKMEKELLLFYFKFLCSFTLSYAIRTMLIHFRDIEDQSPIKKREVIPILKEILRITNLGKEF